MTHCFLLAALITAPVDQTPSEIDSAVTTITKLGGKVTRDAEGNVTAVELKGVEESAIGLLKPFTGLKSLTVISALVTDNGITPILAFEELRNIDIAGCSLTQELVQRMAGMSVLMASRLTGVPETHVAEENSVLAVKKLRGKVERDEKGRVVLVDLANTYATDNDVKQLLAFASLRTLILANSKVTDLALKYIASLKSLTHLDLGCTAVTDEGLLDLVCLSDNLKFLDLSSTDVTGSGLKTLASLHALTELNLEHSAGIRRVRDNLSDSGLEALAQLKNITKLSVANRPITDVGLKSLSKLTTLTSLDLWLTDITDTGLSTLAALKHLSHLNLNRTSITDAGLARLSSLAELSELDLTGTKVSGTGFREFATRTNLKALYLGNTPITDEGLQQISSIKSLISLRLSPREAWLGGGKNIHLERYELISANGYQCLARLTNLSELALCDTSLSDAAMTELVTSLGKLRKLRISGTRVTDAGLKELHMLTNLTHLDLRDTEISDDGLVYIKKLNKLVSLDLNYTRVTDMGANSLRMSLSSCSISSVRR